MKSSLCGLILTVVFFAVSCSDNQRDAALVAVRDIQSTGVAYAAQEEKSAPVSSDSILQDAPPATPPPAAPPADGKAGEAPAEAKSSADVIEDFVASDPRDILEAKTEDLESRQTTPWDTDTPEAFIPETGRKDPMTIISSAIPEELRPPRSSDDDESDLYAYLYAQFATEALAAVTGSLQCHSVIQIGTEKYAQMSFGGGQRFTISEGGGFNQGIPIGGVMVGIAITPVSITTTEVVVSVVASPQGSNISVDKNLVFIPNA